MHMVLLHQVKKNYEAVIGGSANGTFLVVFGKTLSSRTRNI